MHNRHYPIAVKRAMLLLACLMMFFAAYAQHDTTNYAIKENLAVRFYFPGSVGISVPFKNSHTKLNNGFAFNTAAEYRPLYINAIFFRLSYDALSNSYISYVHSLPTNIIQGKLSTQFIVGGMGYRKKLGRGGIYALVQPGLGIRSFDNAVNSNEGVIIKSVSVNSLSVKTDIGIEYYIAPHFAAVFGPSFYKLFSDKGFNAYHAQFMVFNVGISTTIL